MNHYRYFMEDEKLCRCRAEQDNEPENPIGEDFMLSTMYIWWGGYNLGNKKLFAGPEDFLHSAAEGLGKAKTAEYAGKKKGMAETKDKDILDGFSNADLIGLLKKNGYAIFPLFVYEHSGITIHMGEFGIQPGYPFSDRWDAGMAGFVFVRKEDFLKSTGLPEKGWEEAAQARLGSEVELYDMYLNGECYGIIVEELEDGGWTEKESCWGYYSKACGDDLVRELADDIVGRTYLTPEDALSA